ncbi:MAG: membrane dipeptidase [Pseudomonadota bacterium]
MTKSPASLNYDSNSADTDTIGLLAVAQLQPPRTWNSLLQRSLWHARRLHDVAADDARLMMVKTKSDLRELQQRRVAGEAVIGGMLGVEGLHNLEAQASNLQVLFNAGYRMAGLTHFFDNALAGSMHGLEKGGLTDFGRGIVREMEALGMAVDIAHLSPKAVDEVLAMATRPIVVSHGGVKALCNANRNLTDAQIRGVAATGGVIGIGYWPGAVCSTHPDAVAAAIRHVIDLVGIDHVGLGSDYDGAVQVAFDTSALVLITGALQRQGLSEREIAQVMGGNVVRVLSNTLPN